MKYLIFQQIYTPCTPAFIFIYIQIYYIFQEKELRKNSRDYIGRYQEKSLKDYRAEYLFLSLLKYVKVKKMAKSAYGTDKILKV